MTARERRPTPALLGVVTALALTALALGGCTTGGPSPSTTSPTTPATRSTRTLDPVATGSDGAPVPSSSGTSAVDSTRLTSEADLPEVFGCTPGVAPITIPASTTPPPQPPPVTSGTVTSQPSSTLPATVSPAVLVCGSSLADGEALYLWYAPTPAARALALRAALELAAHVHAGPNWVAGGTVSPTMGTVGGEVYR